MFDKLLIANRGEIACRVIRSARRLGIRTVAVYSDADRNALHVSIADEALRIGPAAAQESYLKASAVLDAARRSGAQAIHPGYGFLSENADFAAACEAAGIVFVGPPAAAILAMGSKIGAKRLMASSDVPLVPGYHGDEQGSALLASQAAEIGYPILIKASAGGGGKGMRIVARAEDFTAALDSARREALKAFRDERVLLERYLSAPRHIEVQVFADAHGNCIHLHERDCSIQRRHQKIVEEAPAPGLSAERRAVMGAAAVRAARAVGYRGAGTVEFIAAAGEFFFMEMNTRLQVEHPVTEMITGLDLVEWQLRVAAGEPLPLSQQQIPLAGHAIEVRLYAEDPARDFLPSTGRLTHLRWPEQVAAVRVDSGVRDGDDVTIHYDPMLAKLIVWGEDRGIAIRRLRQALSECEVAGVHTNLALLQSIAAHPQFAAAALHTGFIAQHHDDLMTGPDATALAQLEALLAVGWVLSQQRRKSTTGRSWSPWDHADGWRLNSAPAIRCEFVRQGAPFTVRLTRDAAAADASWLVQVGSRTFSVAARFTAPDWLDARVDGAKLAVRWLNQGKRISVFSGGRSLSLDWHDPLAGAVTDAQQGSLISPMPGQVLQVQVAVGEKVRRGQPLMIVEAMKMEHTILAPADGVVESIGFAAGARVEEGAQLLKLVSSSEVDSSDKGA